MTNHLFNKTIKLLLLTSGMLVIAGAMLGPIYALFVEEIGGDLLDASITGATFAITAGIVTLISGKYSDKIKREEWIMIAGFFITSIGYFSYLWVSNIYHLLIVQVIVGFGGAVGNPAFDAIYSRHLPSKKAGRLWGAWEAMASITGAVGAVAGGLIATYFGFKALFVTMGFLALLPTLWLFVSPKEIF